MKNSPRRTRLRPLASFAFVVFTLPALAAAQDEPAGQVYTPADFTRFAPTNALDMLNQVPGFAVRNDDDQGRGLGQASTNVLINGERPSSKSQSVTDQLSRITTANVERIEIVDGATLELPGLSGQVANVITKGGSISGRGSGSSMQAGAPGEGCSKALSTGLTRSQPTSRPTGFGFWAAL